MKIKGRFTIPAGMRENLRLPKLLDKTSALAKKRGVSMKEMLAELDRIRHDS